MHEIQLIIDGKARGKHLFSKTFFTIRSMTDDKWQTDNVANAFPGNRGRMHRAGRIEVWGTLIVPPACGGKVVRSTKGGFEIRGDFRLSGVRWQTIRQKCSRMTFPNNSGRLRSTGRFLDFISLHSKWQEAEPHSRHLASDVCRLTVCLCAQTSFLAKKRSPLAGCRFLYQIW